MPLCAYKVSSCPVSLDGCEVHGKAGLNEEAPYLVVAFHPTLYRSPQKIAVAKKVLLSVK